VGKPVPRAGDVEHHGFAGALGDEEAAPRQACDGHRCGEAWIDDGADDVQAAVEGDEAGAVGIGSPGDARDLGGRGATEEQQGEFAGGRTA